MEQIYQTLKSFLKTTPIFRTYLLRKCRMNRVFLEDKYDRLNNTQIRGISQKMENDKDTVSVLETTMEME